MPVDVSTRELTLNVEVLEVLPPEDPASYPFGRLRQTGRVIEHEFEVILLENELVEVTIVPALGGRVIRYRDKGREEFLPNWATPQMCSSGTRGVEMHQGIEITLDGERMLTALGPCQAMLGPADSEESPGCAWLSQAVTGRGLSFHLKYSLMPGSRSLWIEARVLNRTWDDVAYNGGVLIGGQVGAWGWSSEAFFQRKEEGAILRFPSCRSIAPRQVDSWTLKLTPFGGATNPEAINSDAAFRLHKGRLEIQVAEPRLAHRLVLLTEDNQTMECPVDLFSEAPTEISLGSLEPNQLALFDPNGLVVLSTAKASEVSPARFDPFDAGSRHIALAEAATAALRESRWEKAFELFERSLLYNADDALCWWGQAFCRRQLGQDSEAYLANAHFLAPLEPVLRAEALLSQPPMEGHAANPLLAPLAVSPEAYLDVACILAEIGHFESLSRWINEALRHSNLPMLRYLLANALLEHTPMVVDAARQVQIAAKTGVTPPYPWRPQEFECLDRLSKRFPDDSQLLRYREFRSFVP